MSLTTFSVFYYNFEFTSETRYINFDEGGPELTADLRLGSFTPSEAAVIAQTAMNDVGGQAYTVAFNRTLRSFTISAPGPFTLRVNTGSSFATSAFPVLGFTGADLTGTNTYTGAQAGYEYNPQFILQDHVSTDNNRKMVMPSVNKSASGKVEVVRFGIERFLTCNIKYITNKRGDGYIIRNNQNGVEDAQALMNYLTMKKPFEFMPDESDRNTYQSFILESTPDEKDGTGYKLKEMYDKGLPFYFETGVITFRLIVD